MYFDIGVIGVYLEGMLLEGMLYFEFQINVMTSPIKVCATSQHFLIWMTMAKQLATRWYCDIFTLKYALLVYETKNPLHFDYSRSIPATYGGQKDSRLDTLYDSTNGNSSYEYLWL